MADAPNTSTGLPPHVASSHIPSHNIALCSGCGNMDPLPLNPECVPLTLFNSYPQSPFNSSLDKRFTNPGPATQGEPEVGMGMDLPTTSHLNEVVLSPRNHTAIYNHDFVNLDLSGMRGNATLQDNAALDQHGYLARSHMVGPTIPPSQSEYRTRQHNVHTNVNQSAKCAPPILRCRWEGCTSRRHFNREADLVRHIKTLHIAPRS